MTTREQIEIIKAYERGEEIEWKKNYEDSFKHLIVKEINCDHQFDFRNCVYRIKKKRWRAKEQMIGWLEAQGLAIDILNNTGCFIWNIWQTKVHRLIYSFIGENAGYFLSRKEATLAAIDAALDYLIKKRSDLIN